MSTPSLVDLLLAEMTDEQALEFAERLRPFLNAAADTPDLLTPTEAARRLQVSSRTITRAAAAGRVPGAIRAGRRWRFAADKLALEPPPGSRPTPTPPPPRPRRRRAQGGAAAAIKGFSRKTSSTTATEED